MNTKTAFGTVIVYDKVKPDGTTGHYPAIVIGHDKADVIVCAVIFQQAPQTVKTAYGYVRFSKISTIHYEDIKKRLGYIRGKELKKFRHTLHSVFADMIYGKHENEELKKMYTERNVHPESMNKLIKKVMAFNSGLDDMDMMLLDALADTFLEDADETDNTQSGGAKGR